MVASWCLVLLALGTPAHFVELRSGMALADTYGIGGADASPWAVPLHVTSVLAVIALVGLARGTASATRSATGERSGRRSITTSDMPPGDWFSMALMVLAGRG